MRPNKFSIVLLLLVMTAGLAHAVPFGAREESYSDSDFLEDFSVFVTEGWDYVAPSIRPLAESLATRAVSGSLEARSKATTPILT